MDTARVSVRVLVADDQAAFRDAAVAVVAETPGFEVCGATSCARDLPCLIDHLRPDLLVLDVRMPGEDPLAVAATLRRGRAVPILLTSAFSRDDVPQECFDLGMGFLPKEDLAPDTLLRAARELTDGPTR